MSKNVYLVIWAGYVHRAVFTTRKAADVYISAMRAKPDSWGVYTVEKLPLDPIDYQTL